MSSSSRHVFVITGCNLSKKDYDIMDEHQGRGDARKIEWKSDVASVQYIRLG